MDDLSLLKNLVSLSGIRNQNLQKTICLLDSFEKVNKNGFNQESIISLLSQINPKLKPLVTLLQNEGRNKNSDYIQYNHPE